MANSTSIRIKRGLKSEMPSELPLGELAFCTDTQELFVGRGMGLGLPPQKVLESDLARAGRFRIVQTLKERDEQTLVENGVICYVDEESVYFMYKNGEWEVFSTNGDGGAVIGTITSSLENRVVTVSTGESVVVDLFFSTPNVGSGKLVIMSNGSELLSQTVTMGSNRITLPVTKGTHNIEMYVIDRGGVYTNSILFTVNCGSLEISTSFNHEKDYNVGSVITFPYVVDTVSASPITTYFIINGTEYFTKSSKGYNTYVFPTLGVGVHKVEVYSKSGDFISNKITFNLVLLSSDTLYVSSVLESITVEEGDQIAIDYRISMKDVKEFNVEYYINDSFVKKGIGVNGVNTYLISSLTQGSHTVTIKVMTTDRNHTAQITVPITVTESSYQMQQPVTAGLLAWFDGTDLSNNDAERGIWKDKSGNNYQGTLHNFNYVTNGWFDNGLKMNGSAYATFDVRPLLDNAELGMTLDIEFETEDIGNEYARVLDYTSNLTSALGLHIDTCQGYMKSNSNTLTSYFSENTKTRVTFVIDRIKKLALVYVNAVLCNASFLTDAGSGNDVVLEDFAHDQQIYLNSEKGTSNFGACTVYNLRVYGRALNSEEILQNHIADIKNKDEQKRKYDFNFNNTIPTMYFYGDDSEMTKDNPVNMRIKYISTDEEKFGSSFDLPACTVQWQGTSSLQYVVKNYKIKLKDESGKKFKRGLRGGAIPESTFCLKADYMDSSHMNNTGMAKIVNRYLYDSKLPPQEQNEKVISAIDGFPMKLYINDELIGIFNFNNDKGNDDSFGLDTDLFPQCVSYEVVANTDTTAGAFNKWTSSTGITELKYLQNDFELRYPDEDDVGSDYGYLTSLKRVIDWVSDADDETFRAEFEQYFNKEYTLKYYLLVITMGMVDNLGKNMMLNTWDGQIWYPCFYDLDTCLALDNTGYLKFDVDIEVEGGTFNTSKSKLWSKLARVFDAELKQLYREMRSTIFKEENIFKVLLEEQIDSIPESLFNLDSEKKYLNFGKTYLHMLHGNRREHMVRWVNERLLYIDTKYGYEGNTKESITVRANKQGNVYFDIKTYSPMYITVRWRNGEEVTQKINRGKSTRFSYNLPTATDQEIFIYGARHLKDIGDISGFNPSSLSFGNATKLTRLICKNATGLQAVGIGGEGYNLKNLQEIDLSGCTKLGTVAGNNSLDVSYCDNLKKLNVWNTGLQSVVFNTKGGNVEEFYPSYSMTTIRLVNQYNLRILRFNGTQIRYNRGDLRALSDGSKASQLIIKNCPSLRIIESGTNVQMEKADIHTYNRGRLNALPEHSLFSEDEYVFMFRFANSFPNLDYMEIDNSLIDFTFIGNTLCRNLSKVVLKNLPNLRAYQHCGNRGFGRTGGTVNDNIEGTPVFENIEVSNCPNFDTLVLARATGQATAFKFKEDFVWDLTHLPLKNLYIQLNLENIKGMILPDTIENFVFEYFESNPHVQFASDGSRCAYPKEDSCLEFITIGSRDEEFVGLDMKNHPFKDFSFLGHPNDFSIYKNINCSPVHALPRIYRAGDFTDDTATFTLPSMQNIRINLDNYQQNSLSYMLKGVDGSDLQITLNKELRDMDCTYMCYHAKNISSSNMSFMSKLKNCKVDKAFTRSDIDRLDLRGFIGNTTTDMTKFAYMTPNLTYVDLRDSDLSNVTNFSYCFKGTSLREVHLPQTSYSNVTNTSYMFDGQTQLAILDGIDGILTNNISNFSHMFNDTHLLKLDFNKLFNTEGWVSRKVTNNMWIRGNGLHLELDEGEEYILDLTEIPMSYGGDQGGNGMFTLQNLGFTKILIDGHDFSTASGFGWDLLFCVSSCPNLKTLKITNSVIPRHSSFPQSCPELVDVDLTGSDFSKTTSNNGQFFNGCAKLRNVKFGTEYPINLTISTIPIELTTDSLVSILQGLKNLTGATTQKITLGTANLEKLSPEQIRIATDKNWTVA